MTFGTPAIFRTFGTCPPPQPSMWKAWMVRPSRTRRVSSTDRHSFSPSLCRATWTSCSSATRSAVSRARVWAPMSSCTLKPQAPPSASASTSGAASEDEPRPRKPMLTGQASKALKAWRSAQGELTPTPQTGPNSWPMIVVTPEASEASMMRGDSRWTWVSTAPAVAISPSPETIEVPVPTTTSTPSRVSGLPARPIDADPALADADGHLADALHRVDHHHVADDDVAGLADGGGLEVQPVAGGLAEAGEELVAVAAARRTRRGRSARSRRAGPGRRRAGRGRRRTRRGRSRLIRRRSALGLLIRSQVSAGGGPAQGLLPGAGRVQRPVDQSGEADRDPLAADRARSPTSTLSPGPKRTEDPAGTAEPHPVGGRPVEVEPRVGLEEVEVRGDADGHGRGVGDRQPAPRAPARAWPGRAASAPGARRRARRRRSGR